MVFKIVQQRKYEKKTLLGNGIECTLTQSHVFPLIHVPCIGSFKLIERLKFDEFGLYPEL